MKKVIFLLALVAVALAPAAMADPITLINGGGSITTNYAGTGAFAGATATITWSLSGNVLTLTVNNTSSMSAVSLSGLAFNSTPDVNWAISAQSGAITGWTNNSSAGGNGIFEVTTANPGSCSNPGTVCNGQTGSISFTLTSFSGNLTIDASSVHLQTNIGSIKPQGSTGVPEPASLFLMGTGLVSFGGVVRRRFKK